MRNKKVGLMGGTFNPIHNGHLIMAEYVYESYQLDKLLFIPTSISVHKKTSHISPKDRLEMTRLAIASNDHFEICMIDMERAEKTYTIDTIQSFRNKYSHTHFYFIIGADSALGLQNWKEAERLMKICRFIVVNRACYPSKELKNHIQYLKDQYNATIEYMKTPDIEISSSMIRERIGSNKSIKYMTPECVESYIHKHKLYYEMERKI